MRTKPKEKDSRPPFRRWLDEKGLTIEGFVAEALKRGVNIRFYSAAKWARGTMPRITTLEDLTQAFPDIRF